MKKILYSVIIILFGFSCSHKKDLEPNYAIVIKQDTDSLSRRAALQLQDYWLKISHKKIEIIEEANGRKPIFIGNSFALQSHQQQLDSLKDDGFIIDINDNSIRLLGKHSLGDLYAVNTFLEEYIGCVKLSAKEEYIPQKQQLAFKNSYKVYNPAFDFRRILFPGRKDKAYREWYKLEELDEWGMFVHTFRHLIPPEKYYNNHPEYFSLVNGRRLQDAQLCLSNPEVIELLITNLGEEIKKQPEKIFWSVSQNDTYNYCECNNCEELYKKYNSYSGAYIQMSNQIARAFPNKQISTLAYQFTRSAPVNIKPDSNVNVMFCSIECNRSMPLADDERSAAFVKDLKNWSAITNNIFLWDYVVQFKNYLTPFPNFSVLQANIQLFKENGVEMMFEQGSGGNWSDLSELKQYLIAKLLWNPNLDVDSLAHHFIYTYYGEAADYIFQYYQLTNRELQKHAKSEFLNIYGFPMDYTDSFLAPKLMIAYKELMDKAEMAVADKSIYLDRVKRTRLPVDFAYVDIAINNNYSEMPSIINTESTQEINPIILELLQNLEDYSLSRKDIKVNERQFTLSAYKKYVINKLEAQLKPNILLDGAHLNLKTKYSDLYPVGGVKALNDQLFGSLDYHHNWLGFHGEDMILDIDLLEPKGISEIQMNFLQAVNSWVFLPEVLEIEYSNDGMAYKTISVQEGDIAERNYLVKSIPFYFSFDSIKTQYIRITAKSIKTCPEWHRGYGKPSWIFIDEIIVN